MAGAPVRMSENATIFIHRIRALAIGELDVMRDTTDFLDKLDDQIACTHGAKAGKPRARFLTVMRGKGVFLLRGREFPCSARIMRLIQWRVQLWSVMS